VALFTLNALAATGDIIGQFPTPGTCPTGLAFDSKYLWIADRKTDSLYKINPDDGTIINSIAAPGYQIEALTVVGDYLWMLDIEENALYKFNIKTGIIERTISSPSDGARGIAWDGEYLWVVDQSDDKLYQISDEDGTTIVGLPAPSKNSSGLCFDGRYLWVTDRIDNMIYMVWPENGTVIVAFPSPAQYPRGLAFDGTFLWNVDYQTDSLYKIIINDTVLYVHGDVRREKLEYTEQVRNYGPGEMTSLDIYLALPHDLPTQTLVDTLSFSPRPTDFPSDKWGQKTAHYHYDNLPAGHSVSVTMQACAVLYKTRYFIFPDKVGSLKDIPKDTAQKYLGDDTKYWTNDPYIKETSQKITSGDTNCYWIARKIFNYLIANMKYELIGGWNVAPTVLKRGTGSCSEYTFVYIALCRAAGLPARYAGAVTVRGDDASTDDVFHRWVEIYLPNYGWIPVDPSGGDSDVPANQANAFGYLNNAYLITTIGGGGSEFLEWNYNSNEFYQAKGPVKVYMEHIGEWSPLGKSELSTFDSGDATKSCKPKK
jgi:transglutaminase-like putative cysteine protease